MKSKFTTMSAASLMTASGCVVASSTLTPNDCNSYPFSASKAAVTAVNISRELTELESVGYRPASTTTHPISLR